MLQARLRSASPDQIVQLQASMEDRVTTSIVGLVGTGHMYAWGQVLTVASVHPAIGLVAALGEAAFWIWVSTHC